MIITLYFRNIRSTEKHNENKLEIGKLFNNIEQENLQMKTLFIFLLRKILINEIGRVPTLCKGHLFFTYDRIYEMHSNILLSIVFYACLGISYTPF